MKRILRVVMLLCLIAIPSLVRAAVIPVTFASSSNRTGCNFLNVVFTASATGCTGTPAYQWYYIHTPVTSSADTVIVSTGSSATASRAFSTIGSYNVGVRIVCGTDTGYSFQNNFVNVTAPPTIDFAVTNPADASPRCVGPVSFTNLSSGDTVCSGHVWTWIVNGPASFANQSTTNATFNFTTPGDYSVTLLFNGASCGCGGNLTRTSYIHIVGTPTACVTRTDGSLGCSAPVSTTFSAGCSTGGTSYHWTATGGTTPVYNSTSANDTTFATNFTSPGDYPVTVVVSNAAGCSATSAPIMVHVGNFTANFLASSDTVCEFQSVTFTDNTTADVIAPVSQTFFIRDLLGNPVKSSAPMVPNPWTTVMDFGPGDYVVVDYLVNGNGCISQASHPLHVRPRPATTVTSDNPYRCAPPLTTGYHATPAINSYTYKWLTPGAVVTSYSATGAAGGANISSTYNAIASNNVTLVVTDIHGCKDSTIYSGISRVAPANVTVSTDVDSGCTPIHVGYHFTIDVAGATINIDNMSFGDGSSNLGSGIYVDTGHFYTAGGSFLTTLNWHLDASLGGCAGTDTVRVLIGSSHPTFAIGTFPLTATGLHLPYSDSVCPNTNVFFKDSGCAACSHSWTVQTGGVAYFPTSDTFSVVYPVPSIPPPLPNNNYTYTEVSCLAGCCDTYRHKMWVFPPSISPNSLSASNAYIAAGGSVCVRRDSIKFTATGVAGAYRYHWYFGPGASDTASTTVPTVAHNFSLSPTTTAVYTVVVTAIGTGLVDSSNCFNAASLVIRLGPSDTVWSMVDSNICLGSDLVVVGPLRGDLTPFNQYFWSWGDGPGVTSVASDNHATHTYTNPANYNVRVIVTNNFGCKDTSQVRRVHVYGAVGTTTFAPNPVCASGLVTFTDGHTFPNSALLKRMVSYAYSPSATTLTSIPITPNTFTHAFAEGTYTVAISDTDNSPKRCSTFDTFVVRSVTPHAYFTSPDTTGACANVAISFHDTNTHCTYAWNFGDGTPTTVASSADSNIVHTYTANGNYNVSVTIMSDGTGGYPAGCSNTFTRNNYIHLTTASGIGIQNFGDTSVGCPPLQVAFGPTSTPTSYLYTYTWSVTGGTPTYSGPYYFDQIYSTGTQTVTMIATSPRGCKDTAHRTVFVGGPTGFITVTPTAGCSPVSVNLHFTNTGSVAVGSNYVWSACPFGSFTTSTPDTTVLYTVAGDYCPPSVIIENGGCIVNVNGTDSVHVYSTPNVSVTHAPRICYGGTDTLMATGANSYSWTSPTAVICTNCSFITASPLTTTVYTVVGTNVSGCTDTQLVTVVVDSPIVISISGKDSVCIGQRDTLTATGGSGIFSWTGYPGPSSSTGLSCNVCNPVIIITTSTHTYWATTTNAAGCKDSASFTVTINPLPVLHVTPDPAYVCAGDSTQLFATGATTYLWKPRIGLSNDSISNPKSGILSNLIYTVTGTTQYGCKDSITVPVESYHRNVTAARADTVICAGDQARLWAQGGLSYIWRPGNNLSDSTIYNPIATPPVTTLYTVFIHENPCFDTIENVLVTVIPLPILRVPPTITIIAGNSVQLYADSLNHVFLTSYAWTPADSTLTCTDCPHPIATPIVTTTYSVSASTIEGCTGHGTVTIKLLCETSQVFIPNTFTPNGDGNNDRFYVSGKGLGLIKRMAVYNRWGELVYEANNVRPNDPGAGWDGTYRGEIVAPDVFVYVLDVMCSTGEPFVFRGDISLVR